MESNIHSGRVVIYLLLCIVLTDLPGSCFAGQTETNTAVMVAVQTLLFNNHDTTAPAPSIIGAREVQSSPVEQGTLFAAPDGRLNDCTPNAPCSVRTAFSRLTPGDTLFLRGGTYDVTAPLRPGNSGLEDNPIIIESYPGETAILEGHYSSAEDVSNNPGGRTSGIRLGNDHSYIIVRKIEVKHMGWAGISVYGSNNIVEGCHTHNNMISGIALYGGEWHEDNENYIIPYPYGYNIIRDNISNANSDVGLPANGGNSDGIAISSGRYNTIIHNTVYANSDDGIDTWRSNDSFLGFNLVYDNGRGDGNGNGIKAGGNLNPDATNGLRAVVKHNISYDNKKRGLDYNAGHDVIFQYNTSFRNGTVGINGAADTTVEFNIASHNGSQNSQLGTNNSWNIQEQITFLSTDPNSPDFLKPESGFPFIDMGAYANLSPHQAKIFIIGGSTVHNTSVGEQGYGARLGEYMINPDKIFNRARSGASTKSYRPDMAGTTRDWPGLIALLRETDISEGAYLLLHFGHNDEDDSRPSLFTEPGRGNDFYNNLKAFVHEVSTLGVTPVLVTPVNRMYKGSHTHITAYGDYPQTIKFLAEDEQILLLDLEEKSFNEFNTYPDTESIFNQFAYDDHTHFDPDAAKIVAGWLKELACDSSDQLLCNQFK
jgi:lysophospholipase L1-like esterase